MIAPLLALMVLAAPASSAPAVRRVAVLVGATRGPPGKAPLRYSYHDVQEMQDVLVQVGDFKPADVHVLLDPAPSAVIDALDSAVADLRGAAPETMLLFYYSGHADDRALYPNGQALPVSLLKERLERKDATVRLGILDSCSGGGWTRTKGLQAEAPFEVEVPLALTSEGSALIAASSGLESAHESSELEGSFFTHHFVAGLRGAAARSGEGQVTLGEAFAYAEERTIRDSAEQADAPQHPSFDIHLRGRQDLALAQLDSRASGVDLQETLGPLRVIHLQTGRTVLEVPPGRRSLQLALAPGRYLVQRRINGQTAATEIEIQPGQTLPLDEDTLELVGSAKLASKRESDDGLGRFTFALRGGVIHEDSPDAASGPEITSGSSSTRPDLSIGFTWRITDRLTLSAGTLSVGTGGGGLSYRFGDRGGLEVIPWAGLTQWGLSLSSTSGDFFEYGLGTGVTTRWWLTSNRSLNVGLLTESGTAEVPLNSLASQTGGTTLNSWSAEAWVGFSQHIKQVVTLNLGVAAAVPYLESGSFSAAGSAPTTFSLGAVQAPLVVVHLTPAFSLDAWATVYVKTNREIEDEYLGGCSFSF